VWDKSIKSASRPQRNDDYIVPQMSILPIGYNLAIADFAAHEYIGTLRYYLYNLLGWNPAESRKV
jgi:hypothetical protein